MRKYFKVGKKIKINDWTVEWEDEESDEINNLKKEWLIVWKNQIKINLK